MYFRFAFSTLVVGAFIFLYGGISQMFPWGVPSVQMIHATNNPDQSFMTSPKNFFQCNSVFNKLS